ncbi:hypothetical protein ACFQPC_00270 [Herminiimonas glaciei]|uniref:Superfamily III holin-X n=1 Tax=Herminiimonas glaciei TaxID=523788 RepID=A0ABW2I6G1_9BURK
MSDELNQLELEITRIRLAKEQLELREAIQREERKRKIGVGADRVISFGVAAAQSSVAAIAKQAESEPISGVKIVIRYSIAIAIFYGVLFSVNLLGDGKNPWLIVLTVVALVVSGAFALSATILLLKKLLQIVFRRG